MTNLLKKVINANPGDADHVGGNDWDRIADYFSGTNTTDTITINTDTRYLSGILKLRDSTNTYNVLMKSLAQSSDRDFTIPALTGNDSPAMLNLSNNFLQVQQIQLDIDSLFYLYRPANTANSLCGLSFFHRNSSNTGTLFANISSKLMTNTAGLEDGQLIFYVKKAGVLTEVMRIDKDGLLTCNSLSAGGGGGISLAVANTWTAIQTFGNNNAVPAVIYRTANTVLNLAGISFDQQNSSAAQKTYGRIQSKIITNTAGSENGAIIESVIKGGTVTTVRTSDQNGNMTIGSGQNILVGGVLLNTGVTVSTASTSTEFDMLNYSVPGNLLGANGALRVTISGYVLQNQATVTNFTIRVKFGATTIYQCQTANVLQLSTNMPFYLSVTIGNKNATNSQGMHGHMLLEKDWATQGTLTTGEGHLTEGTALADANFRAATGASTKDTTTAQTLQVTMQHSVNSASVVTNVQRRMIEFLPGT